MAHENLMTTLAIGEEGTPEPPPDFDVVTTLAIGEEDGAWPPLPPSGWPSPPGDGLPWEPIVSTMALGEEGGWYPDFDLLL